MQIFRVCKLLSKLEFPKVYFQFNINLINCNFCIRCIGLYAQWCLVLNLHLIKFLKHNIHTSVCDKYCKYTKRIGKSGSLYELILGAV